MFSYNNFDNYEKALRNFGSKIEIICALEMSKKYSSEEAYQRIKKEIKILKKIRKKFEKS